MGGLDRRQHVGTHVCQDGMGGLVRTQHVYIYVYTYVYTYLVCEFLCVCVYALYTWNILLLLISL